MDKGTKGGRLRHVPIDTDEKRALVDRVKLAIPVGDSLSGKSDKTLESAKKWLCRQLKVIGMTQKDLGVTMHSLRHGYVHRELAARNVLIPIKVRNQRIQQALQAELDQIKPIPIPFSKAVAERKAVAEALSHSRISVNGA